jgi:hypothetical protein
MIGPPRCAIDGAMTFSAAMSVSAIAITVSTAFVYLSIMILSLFYAHEVAQS